MKMNSMLCVKKKKKDTLNQYILEQNTNNHLNQFKCHIMAKILNCLNDFLKFSKKIKEIRKIMSYL